MKLHITIAFFLLPYMALAAYDESSTHEIKLEDIENEHLQNERKSKAHDPQSMPPPLSKQPAKGQPVKLHPSVPDQSKSSATTAASNRYTTRAEQHVQPLTDQPNPPHEADYHQSPTYQRETVVYVSGGAEQRPEQQQYENDKHQQPSPLFYYSHDAQTAQQQGLENGYQLQFVPIDGSNEERVPQQEQIAQKQESAQYLAPKENAIQRVHGLSAGAFYGPAEDIKYAPPAAAYGAPPNPQQHYPSEQGAVEYSQQTPYASEQQAVEYTSSSYSHSDANPLQDYGAPSPYYGQHKQAITYGPPDSLGHIQYGAPDAPFHRPKSQSNQSVYAPRRPEQSGRSNEAPFAVSFPYPPSFISITTESPPYEKAASQPVYNEIPQWQGNVMSLHLLRPQGTQYQIPAPAAVNQHLELQSSPVIDIFHHRQAKSLLDSYIPSWLVFRVREEHARRIHQQQLQQQEQLYPVPSASAEEPTYNTLAYSAQYEPTKGNDRKRSVHQQNEETKLKKKPTSTTKKAPVAA